MKLNLINATAIISFALMLLVCIVVMGKRGLAAQDVTSASVDISISDNYRVDDFYIEEAFRTLPCHETVYYLYKAKPVCLITCDGSQEYIFDQETGELMEYLGQYHIGVGK